MNEARRDRTVARSRMPRFARNAGAYQGGETHRVTQPKTVFVGPETWIQAVFIRKLHRLIAEANTCILAVGSTARSQIRRELDLSALPSFICQPLIDETFGGLMTVA